MLLWILTALVSELYLCYSFSASCVPSIICFSLTSMKKIRCFPGRSHCGPQGTWITVHNYYLTQRWGKSTGLLKPLPVVMSCSHLPSCGSKNLIQLQLKPSFSTEMQQSTKSLPILQLWACSLPMFASTSCHLWYTHGNRGFILFQNLMTSLK